MHGNEGCTGSSKQCFPFKVKEKLEKRTTKKKPQIHMGKTLPFVVAFLQK